MGLLLKLRSPWPISTNERSAAMPTPQPHSIVMLLLWSQLLSLSHCHCCSHCHGYHTVVIVVVMLLLLWSLCCCHCGHCAVIVMIVMLLLLWSLCCCYHSHCTASAKPGSAVQLCTELHRVPQHVTVSQCPQTGPGLYRAQQSLTDTHRP
jgi:hypothetical protein